MKSAISISAVPIWVVLVVFFSSQNLSEFGRQSQESHSRVAPVAKGSLPWLFVIAQIPAWPITAHPVL